MARCHESEALYPSSTSRISPPPSLSLPPPLSRGALVVILALECYAISHAQSCAALTYGQIQIDICAEREEGKSVVTLSEARICMMYEDREPLFVWKPLFVFCSQCMLKT